nr:class I SAM-dependent methyltransferase [Synechococcus sp. CCY 0621]
MGGLSYRSIFANPDSLHGTANLFRHAIRLGLHDYSSLNRITNKLYTKAADFGSKDHNLAGLWPWEQKIVDEFFASQHYILVAGAGGGREAIALAKQGFSVTAFDFCAALTKACRSHLAELGLKARVLDAPPDCAPPELTSELFVYDAIFLGRGFYHHIPGRTRRALFLKGCRQFVRQGAPLFLSDFFNRQTSDPFYYKTYMVAKAIRTIRLSPDPVELGDWLSNCMQHAFVASEIEAEMKEAKFRLKHYLDTPFGLDTQLAHAVGIAQ